MTKEITEIKKITNGVEGWLTDEEGETLYNLAKNCTGRGVIVEIGSLKGKSTIWLAKGSNAGNKTKIYAIDPHNGSPEHQKVFEKINTLESFKKNIKNAKVEDIVYPIVKTSEEAAASFDHSVELIFIDGNHEYDSVKKDFEIWFPKLINNGTIVFHDTTQYEGPKKVVKDNLYMSRNFRHIKFRETSMVYAKKVEQNSTMDQIENRCALYSKYLYTIKFYTKYWMDIIKKKIGKVLLHKK